MLNSCMISLKTIGSDNDPARCLALATQFCSIINKANPGNVFMQFTCPVSQIWMIPVLQRNEGAKKMAGRFRARSFAMAI